MNGSNLNEPTTVDLQGAGSLEEMAQREMWSPERYAVVLAENIRRTDIPLDRQRERLAALAQVGGSVDQIADQAAADALAQHYVVLEALHQRFALQAFEALNTNSPKAAEIADKYLSASLKAQRAAMACLSSLKILRDAQRGVGASTPTTPAQGALTVDMIELEPKLLSKKTDC